MLFIEHNEIPRRQALRALELYAVVEAQQQVGIMRKRVQEIVHGSRGSSGDQQLGARPPPESLGPGKKDLMVELVRKMVAGATRSST